MYFEYVLDDRDQSDLFRRRVDEQRYSQTDCNVWLKSGIPKGDATASVFSHLVVFFVGVGVVCCFLLLLLLF